MCNNCFNGCVETTSDSCVKYTGSDISSLGINTGDNLSSVLSILIQNLTTSLNGMGIKIDLDESTLCTEITSILPSEPNLVNILQVFSTVLCDQIANHITPLEEEISVLEADYNLGNCIEGVLPGQGTHAVVQAVINTVCSLVEDINTLTLSLNDYVLTSQIGEYIENYITSQQSNKMYTKMVPYTVVEYYGNLNVFNLDGAGIGDWEKIYLCNGKNGTPDKRGRIPIGTTVMGNGNFDPTIDPANGNPTYDLNTLNGQNKVALTTANLPSHTHTATVSINDPGHTHTTIHAVGYEGIPNAGAVSPAANAPINDPTSVATTGITATATLSSIGGGEAHNNIPPVLACHYIMYIP